MLFIRKNVTYAKIRKYQAIMYSKIVNSKI